jgi:hypothetical protein
MDRMLGATKGIDLRFLRVLITSPRIVKRIMGSMGTEFSVFSVYSEEIVWTECLAQQRGLICDS